MTCDLNDIAAELDMLHRSVKAAYGARDVSAYQEYFTADLFYIQVDGQSIGREQLLQDVSKQLKQHKVFDSVMTRESIELNDDGTITQVACQSGSMASRAFLTPSTVNIQKTQVQLCIVHMVRNSMRLVPWKDYKAVTADLKRIYQATNRRSLAAARGVRGNLGR